MKVSTKKPTAKKAAVKSAVASAPASKRSMRKPNVSGPAILATEKAAQELQKRALKNKVAKDAKRGKVIELPASVDTPARKAKEVKPHIVHDELVGADFLVLGELRLPVDGRDEARTLGCGPYGYGKGLVDGWSDAVWKTILARLGLPHEPLVREIAQWPVKRWVARIYREHFDPRTLLDEAALAKFSACDEKAVAKYLADFEQAKNLTETRSENAVKNLVGKGFQRKDSQYKPTDALKKQSLKGQQLLIFDFFKKAKWAVADCPAIAKVVGPQLTTRQPVERVVGFYLNAWRHNGWLEVV